MVWTCDSCGQEIVSIKDGWVEWTGTSDGKKLKGLRLVHHNGTCQYSSRMIQGDMDLEHYSSVSGLMELLEMISDDAFLNNEEVLEMIKRLHINGYEKVRNHLSKALSEGIFEKNTKIGYPQENQMELVSEWLDNRR